MRLAPGILIGIIYNGIDKKRNQSGINDIKNTFKIKLKKKTAFDWVSYSKSSQHRAFAYFYGKQGAPSLEFKAYYHT